MGRFQTLQRWDEEGSLPIRISSYMPLGDFKRVANHRAWNGGWLREGQGDIEGQFIARTRLGGVKAFLDGSLGGRTAAFVDAYSDEPSTKGKLMYPQGEEENYLREQSLAADELGLQIAFHAIGDAAVNQALDIAALLESSNGENKLRRLRVEHAQHLTSPIDEQMTRFRAVDAIASVQPAQIPLRRTERGREAGRRSSVSILRAAHLQRSRGSSRRWSIGPSSARTCSTPSKPPWTARGEFEHRRGDACSPRGADALQMDAVGAISPARSPISSSSTRRPKIFWRKNQT